MSKPSKSEIDYLVRVARAHIKQKPGLSLERLSVCLGIPPRIRERSRDGGSVSTVLSLVLERVATLLTDEGYLLEVEEPRRLSKIYPPGYQKRELFKPARALGLELELKTLGLEEEMDTSFDRVLAELERAKSEVPFPTKAEILRRAGVGPGYFRQPTSTSAKANEAYEKAWKLRTEDLPLHAERLVEVVEPEPVEPAELAPEVSPEIVALEQEIHQLKTLVDRLEYRNRQLEEDLQSRSQPSMSLSEFAQSEVERLTKEISRMGLERDDLLGRIEKAQKERSIWLSVSQRLQAEMNGKEVACGVD